MGSPYGARESLQWLVHLARPSWAEETELEKKPLSARLVAVTSDTPIVRIVLFGDLMPFWDRQKLAVTPAVRSFVRQADLVIGNCETPVAAKTTILPIMFAMGVDRVRSALETLGVQDHPGSCVLSVANNHAGDQRMTGFEETLARLRALGITIAGVHRNGNPAVPMIQAGPLQVAVLAWTDWINRDFRSKDLGVCRREHLDLQITAAREANADCLLGFPHWDYEFRLFPSVKTVQCARRILSRGITALVGHHPHVLQPIVLHPEGLCMYSLGNTTPLPTNLVRWPTLIGGVVCLEIVGAGEHLGAIAGYRVLPIRIRREPRRILVSAISVDDPISPNEQTLLGRLFPTRPGADSPQSELAGDVVS